ncbi:transglutaminase family protein [Pseudonocardia sp. CA-107938]|uniref:transglutaminase family protein n=1 Tax=Pseudonocardia sp. CA-107938 TaxID=3240021 RepID=UPI003D90F764
MTEPRTFTITHRTRFGYDADVRTSFGRAHLIPRPGPGQPQADGEVVVDPAPDEQREHVDAFGNRSTYFAVRAPHRELTVLARSTVVVDRTGLAVDGCGWEAVRDTVHDLPERTWALPSPRLPTLPGVAAYAAPSFPPRRPVGEAVSDLCSRIHRDFRYASGTTTVASTLTDLLDGGEGVCQDFAHLAVAALRSVGLAARYVSGYLETSPPPGVPKLRGADASHAWVSAWTPDGWFDVDPTNDVVVGSSHVVLAHGRDYADVPPLRGVLFSDRAAVATMAVEVDMDRTG